MLATSEDQNLAVDTYRGLDNYRLRTLSPSKRKPEFGGDPMSKQQRVKRDSALRQGRLDLAVDGPKLWSGFNEQLEGVAVAPRSIAWGCIPLPATPPAGPTARQPSRSRTPDAIRCKGTARATSPYQNPKRAGAAARTPGHRQAEPAREVISWSFSEATRLTDGVGVAEKEKAAALAALDAS